MVTSSRSAKLVVSIGALLGMIGSVSAQAPCEIGKLLDVELEEEQHFGWSVVIKGDVALVGAPETNVPFSGPGSLYVFRFDGETWVLEQRLEASDGEDGDEFGKAT